MKPKLVFLTSRFPFPLEKGDKLRAYHQIRTLTRKFDIYLISIADYTIGKKELENILPMVRELHVIKISPLQRILSIFKALWSDVPFQVAMFEDPHAARYIRHIITEIQPNHIFCQLARIAPYVMDLPYAKTLDYMDAFGIGMLRRASVTGMFSGLLYKLEAKRMLRFEQRIFDRFDYHTVISEQDKAELQPRNKKPIHIIPNGIDERFFLRNSGEKDFDLLFVGNMGYLPNVEAAEFIAKSILPLCPPSVRLMIAGARPHKRVRRLQSQRVTITGWMDDIADAYARAKIFVAPIWSGTGQQNKILEAMAMGLPCITTTAVNNAINAAPEKEIFIAEAPKQFADLIQYLLDNPQKAAAIGNAGKSFVKQNYSWEHYSAVLYDIFAAKFNRI